MNVNEEILYLRRKCMALEDLSQRLVDTFKHEHVEFQVIYRDGDRWFLSTQMYPGVNRESAIKIAEYERGRGKDVRIQIRTCSCWTDATDMKSIFEKDGCGDGNE